MRAGPVRVAGVLAVSLALAFAVFSAVFSTAFSRGDAGERAAAPRPVAIAARALASFQPGSPEARRFGALEFRGGLVLQARDDGFGGWSGLWRSPDGSRLAAVSDRGTWLTAAPVYAQGRLAGLSDAVLAPILGPDGRALAQTRSYDTESLAIAGRDAFVGIERTHEVMRFDWGREGTAARGRPLPVPPAVKRLPANKGLEAIGVAPPTSPIAGSVVAIAERSAGSDEPTAGWILTGRSQGAFQIARSGRFDITDLAFLPDGDMLVLERFYEFWSGAAMRIRRIDGRTIRPGALLDGPVLVTAGMGEEIDNMEGLAVHRNAAGETILTLISDDNFSLRQRTLLLEFALERDPEKRVPAFREDHAQTMR